MNESTENDTILATCCVHMGLLDNRTSLLWLQGNRRITPSNETQTVVRTDENEIDLCSTINFQCSRLFHDVPLVCLVLNERNISTVWKMTVFCKFQSDLLQYSLHMFKGYAVRARCVLQKKYIDRNKKTLKPYFFKPSFQCAC